jgi:hypothetical protein
MLAQAYLGNLVQIKDGNNQVSGRVDAVEKLDDGSSKLIIDGNSYDANAVTRVELADSSTN